ncbi:C1 family peptidase [Salipiger bermudensis]|uniref:C1 family peptidase n=1 Tax=Salipiger bermudensis TaxID=344736 RepID=UPI00300B7AB1
MQIDDLIESAVRENDLDALIDIERRLLTESMDRAVPFAPAITLSTEALAAYAPEDAEEMRGFGDAGIRTFAMHLGNRIAKAKRRIRFRHKIAGGFDGIVVFSEGDSWFQYPVFLRDVIDHLMDDADKAVLSFGEAGDLLANMADRREYAGALDEFAPKVFLLSGGGNDLFGEGQFEGLLRPYAPGLKADDLIDMQAYGALMTAVEADYRRLLGGVLEARPDMLVFGHAYDLPHPQEDGPWIGTPLQNRGIPEDIGHEIVGRILDDFATLLRLLDTEIPNYSFVDVKGVVGSSPNSWADEIHPKSAGFGRVAAEFRDAIDVHLARGPADRSAGMAATGEERPISAATYSVAETERDRPLATDAEGGPANSSFSERARMAKKILDFEARRDANGRLAVYHLPPGDCGGRYEVAGINERYHKEEADHLVALIEAGQHVAAETYAIEMIAGYTDPADRWCSSRSIEFYLRDCMFNRGPGGAAWIVQHAVGVETDRVVGPITRTAIRTAEADPRAFLQRLRASREVYERRKRNESSRFWRGLVNRWNNALDFALSFLEDSGPVQAEADAAPTAAMLQAAESHRILNCVESQKRADDWTISDARSADILRTSYQPEEYDLREEWWTVGDQRATGSCVGWATADSVLRWHFVQGGRLAEDEQISVRFIWMAAKETDEFRRRPTSFIEEAGTSLKAALDVARKLGCVTERVLPFDREEVFTGTEAGFYSRASRLKIASYHNLGRSLTDWRQWLYQNGPILTRLNVDNAFYNAAQTGGRLTQHDPNARGGHAVSLVGYTREGFIVRNSWSARWGDRGFALATDSYAESAFTEAYGVTV